MTFREDCGAIDQAADTLSRAFLNYDKSSHNFAYKLYQNCISNSTILDKKEYKEICINLNDLDAEKLHAMFNRNFKIK